MTRLACALAVTFFAGGSAAAIADEFQTIKCGGDIPKAMIGQRSGNGRIVDTEKKYPALGLKHLGSDEISDELSSVDWRICGTEYSTLIRRKSGVVADVIAIPSHSKQSPAFTGTCQLKGKDLPDIIFAILNRSRDAENLPAASAWKIDQEAGRFIRISTEGLLCPKTGIYSVDGGL